LKLGAIGAGGRRRQVPAAGGIAVDARAAADSSAWLGEDPAKAAGMTTKKKARTNRDKSKRHIASSTNSHART